MSLLFLGIYSGFLATIPIGPSKILSVRNFLIKSKGSDVNVLKLDIANSSFIAGITGLLVAQAIMILSVYYPSLYSLWMKPHLFTMLFLPLLFAMWNKIKVLDIDTYNNERLGYSNLYNFHIQTAFLETLLLQLLNPIVFPNSAFSRLFTVFLFRYSSIFTFLFGIFIGFVSGYTAFFFLTIFLLKRLDNDTPVIYRLVKRVIHRVFFPILFVVFLVSLGRTPIPSIKNVTKESWKGKPWPDVFFNSDLWNRPMRLLKNNQSNLTDENMRAFNKMYFSQFFFEISRNNGKRELYYDFPENLSIVYKELDNLLKDKKKSELSEDQIASGWIYNKKNRKNEIEKNLNKRLLFLKRGNLLEDILDKQLGSMSQSGNLLNKEYDPRLSTNLYSKEIEIQHKSPLLINSQYFIEKIPFTSTEKINLFNINTTNRLKLFLSNNSKNIKEIPILLWKPLIDRTNIDIKKSELNNLDIDIFIEKNNLSIDSINKLHTKQNVSWNTIFLNLEKLLKIEKNFDLINKNKLSINDYNNLLKLYKKLPLWNSKITKSDLQTPEPNKSRLVLNNFVRNLLPGSIRARRRKALAWNIYQNRPHAPIFLHAIDSLKLNNKSITEQYKKDFSIQTSRNAIQNHANILKNRWNFTIAHFVRGIALCGQAYIRRYIRIPVFIIIKNISRQILLLPTEWEQDWKHLSQEIYIDCDYDGNDLYVGIKLPNLFELSGKQVKILGPFPFKFSSKIELENNITDNNKLLTKSIIVNEKISKYMLDTYSYLTIWGDETYEPFGKIKESPYFLKPIFKRLELIIQYKILNQYKKIFCNFSWMNKYIQPILRIIYKPQNNISRLLNTKNSETNLSIAEINSSKIDKNKLIAQEKELITNQLPLYEQKKLTKSLKEIKYYEGAITKNKFGIEENSNKISKQTILRELKYNKKDLDSKSIIIKHAAVVHRKNTLQHQYIYIKKYLFKLNRFMYKTQKDFFFTINKYKKNINRYLNKNIYNIKEFVLILIFHIHKSLIAINSSLSQLFNSYIFEVNNFMRSNRVSNLIIQDENRNQFDTNFNKSHLSQAYIIHKINQQNIIKENNIDFLLGKWNKNKKIESNLEKLLNDTKILETPYKLKYTDFQMFFDDSYGYTPSLKIWRHIVPKSWSESVKKCWESKSQTHLDSNVNKGFSSEKPDFNNLFYHTPLCEKVDKLYKISDINFILKKYTNCFKNNNINIIDNNNLHLKLQNPTKNLTNILYKDKEIPNDSISNLKDYTSSLSLKHETQDKYFQFSTIHNVVIKEIPIVEKEMKRLNSKIRLNSIKNRISYSPTRQNKWRFAELKTRLRNLMRTAKQRTVLKESLLDQKYAIEIPYQMRKDLNMFYKSFEPEDILFINALENWRYKVLDDELLMYNMVSSFLKFINKEEKGLKNVNLNHMASYDFFNKDIANRHGLLPETLLLPNHIRELRILEKLNLDSIIDKHKSINQYNIENTNHADKSVIKVKDIANGIFVKTNTHMSSDKTRIMQFLWPTHRLEDLAFINRFWLGTSNQSKFSLLRIRTYPID
jgi:hypothetical protein